MKHLQLILFGLIACFFIACQSNTNNKNANTSSSESRIVNITYSLEVEHDKTIGLRPRQNIIHTYGRSSLELDAVEPPYIETIAGLRVYDGFKLKLEFDDATKCHIDDDCIYKALLSIKVDGVIVASQVFNCANGLGTGSINYTFE